MSSEKFPKTYTLSNRPEEVDHIHGRDTEDKGSVEQQGRQLIDEASRSISALMDGMANGQIDMGDPAMHDAVTREFRRMTKLVEDSSQNLRRIRAGGDATLRPEHSDRLSRFVQFSDVVRHEVARRAAIFRHGIERFRNGDITTEDYRKLLDEREQFHASMRRKISENSMGIDPDNHVYRKTLEFLEEELATLPGLEAEERLGRLWDRLEKKLMPFVKAHAAIQELLTRGRAKPEDLREAWEDKRRAYERMCARIFKMKGLTSVEAAELEERARGIIRPDEIPADISEETLPSIRAATNKPLAASERRLSWEEYEEGLRKVMKHVDDLDSIADSLERGNAMTDNAKKELLDQLRVYSADVLDLDERAEQQKSSSERRVLLDIMQKLRYRLSDPFYVSPYQHPRPEKEPGRDNKPPVAKAAGVGHARAAYDRVAAAYASVQHTLSLEQRRQMRTELAGLSSLVRRADLAASIERAVEHAPALAHASLTSTRPVTASTSDEPAVRRRGLSAFFGEAFKLK